MTLDKIKTNLVEMAELTLQMLEETHAGFEKHDLEILGGVLKKEQSLNKMEKDLTLELIGLAKKTKNSAEKKSAALLEDIVGHLEVIGDYCKDMVERVEIKIHERLLFSEEGLSEYTHLYHVVYASLTDVVKALRMQDKNFASRTLHDEEHVDKLADTYRNNHVQRLMEGTCNPMAGNMFLNLLDFTAAIFNHTKKIAGHISELLK